MKTAGIVRRIDSLGRIVIPKGIRRSMRMKEGDPVEIFTDRTGQVVIKKYSPLGELENSGQEFAESMSHFTGKLVCIVDSEKVLAAAGNGKRGFKEKYISADLKKYMQRRPECVEENAPESIIKIVEEQEQTFRSQIIVPVVAEGDMIGAIIVLGQEKMSESDKKMAMCGAEFFGKQME